MKIRRGFVSNSSSSSFIVRKDGLSPLDIDIIKNHIHHALKITYDKNIKKEAYGYPIFGLWDLDDKWDYVESEHLILLYTSMNNFELGEFLKNCGIIGVYYDEYLGWADDAECLEEVNKLEKNYEDFPIQKRINM